MIRPCAGNNSSRRICAQNPCRLRRWSGLSRRLGIVLKGAPEGGIVKSDANSDRPGDANRFSGLCAGYRPRGRSARRPTRSRFASMCPTEIRTACDSSTAWPRPGSRSPHRKCSGRACDCCPPCNAQQRCGGGLKARACITRWRIPGEAPPERAPFHLLIGQPAEAPVLLAQGSK